MIAKAIKFITVSKAVYEAKITNNEQTSTVRIAKDYARAFAKAKLGEANLYP
jgi:hypothetical protein